jgi:hypothetical protein
MKIARFVINTELQKEEYFSHLLHVDGIQKIIT